MKVTIGGKRYDSDRCEKLAKWDHYTPGSNNYSGTTTLILAKDKTYLLHTESNGQDCWLRNSLSICENPVGWLDEASLSDDEEARLVELGLIEII